MGGAVAGGGGGAVIGRPFQGAGRKWQVAAACDARKCGLSASALAQLELLRPQRRQLILIRILLCVCLRARLGLCESRKESSERKMIEQAHLSLGAGASGRPCDRLRRRRRRRPDQRPSSNPIYCAGRPN